MKVQTCSDTCDGVSTTEERNLILLQPHIHFSSCVFLKKRKEEGVQIGSWCPQYFTTQNTNVWLRTGVRHHNFGREESVGEGERVKKTKVTQHEGGQPVSEKSQATRTSKNLFEKSNSKTNNFVREVKGRRMTKMVLSS